MKKICIAIMMLFLSATAANAEFSLDEYGQIRGDAVKMDIITTYINGVGVGFGWADTYMSENAGLHIFCQPEDLSLNASNMVDILDREIKRFEYTGNIPIELILLLGLIQTFPCK